MLWTLHEMFPSAPIYTAMWNRRGVTRFASCDVRTSWMQHLPHIEQAPRAYAALYPLAFASMKVTGFDLLISLTTSFAKGVRNDATLQLCYCNSPSNFVWRSQAYFRRRLTRSLSAPLRAWLRAWDRHAARQPDLWITSGQAVADRIRLTYGRDAAIVSPGIDASWFIKHQGDEFYLAVGRMVPHKRIDLAIQACRKLSVPLWVTGDGRAADDLRRLAGPSVHFTGRVSDEQLRDLYSRARAVLVPAEEDFGLVPLEAQAAGTPVIAYDAGGAQETVIHGETGLRFAPQTVEALASVITDGERLSWDRERIRANAARYNVRRFRQELSSLIDRHYRPMDSAGRP